MKKLFLFLIFLFLFPFFSSPVHASLLTVDQEGIITPNVLGYDTESLEIKSLAGLSPTSGTITLSNSEDKTKLTVATSRGEHSLDVTDIDQNLIEVEETISPQKITISEENGQFVITQGGISATTNYAIKLSTQDHQFMLVAPSGHKFLSTLPLEAVNYLESASIISRPLADTTPTISEDESGELVYTIPGEKIIKPLDLLEITVPVTANVSATTGKITKINGPLWYRIFGLLLV